MDTIFIKNIIQSKKPKDDLHISSVAATLFAILLVIAVVGALLMDGRVPDAWIGAYVAALTLVGTYILYALKVASQWEKAVVLRLGRFLALRGPGVFWIIPIVDWIPSWIDHRVMVTPFAAEKTLTKDTVPVDVDAVLFWGRLGRGKGCARGQGLPVCTCLGSPNCTA